MIKLVFIFSSLFALNTMGVSKGSADEMNTPTCESQYIDWCLVELFEIEEVVELDFNTKDYLPENFNPLKGKIDIDWSLVELFEIEETVELDFNTKDYLPENFSPCDGMS